jgi:hypothetical protein
VYNNPLRYTDPSGHCAADDFDCQRTANHLHRAYGWIIYGTWAFEDVQILLSAARKMLEFFSAQGGGDAIGRMRAAFGEVAFHHPLPIVSNRFGPWFAANNAVYLAGWSFDEAMVIHEMGHILDDQAGSRALPGGATVWGGGLGDAMAAGLGGAPKDCLPRNWCGWPFDRTRERWDTGSEPLSQAPDVYVKYARQGSAEDFADAFKYAVLGNEQNRHIRAQIIKAFVQLQVDTAPRYFAVPYPGLDAYQRQAIAETGHLRRP